MTIPAAPEAMSAKAVRVPAVFIEPVSNSGGVLRGIQATASGQLPQHPGDRGVMLLGENLSGCQQNGLVPGVDDLEHGA